MFCRETTFQRTSENLALSHQENENSKIAIIEETRRIEMEKESIRDRFQEVQHREQVLQDRTQELDHREEQLNFNEGNFQHRTSHFADQQKSLDDWELDLRTREDGLRFRLAEAEKEIKETKEDLNRKKTTIEVAQVELNTEKATYERLSKTLKEEYEKREAQNLEHERSLASRELLLQSFGHMVKDKIEVVIDQHRPPEELNAEVIEMQRVSLEDTPDASAQVTSPMEGESMRSASEKKRTRSSRPPEAIEEEEEDGTPKKSKSIARKDSNLGWSDRLRDTSHRRDQDKAGPSRSS